MKVYIITQKCANYKKNLSDSYWNIKAQRETLHSVESQWSFKMAILRQIPDNTWPAGSGHRQKYWLCSTNVISSESLEDKLWSKHVS